MNNRLILVAIIDLTFRAYNHDRTVNFLWIVHFSFSILHVQWVEQNRRIQVKLLMCMAAEYTVASIISFEITWGKRILGYLEGLN